MKRAGNLFEAIVDRDNLRSAFHRAVKGKRACLDARCFAERLDQNLYQMSARVKAATFPLGRYRQFLIHDPKERIITAPCFAERVLHHAIMNVCEPAFRAAADLRHLRLPARSRATGSLGPTQEFATIYPAFLKMDIRKYFDSVPHDVAPGTTGLCLQGRSIAGPARENRAELSRPRRCADCPSVA